MEEREAKSHGISLNGAEAEDSSAFLEVSSLIDESDDMAGMKTAVRRLNAEVLEVRRLVKANADSIFQNGVNDGLLKKSLAAHYESHRRARKRLSWLIGAMLVLLLLLLVVVVIIAFGGVDLVRNTGKILGFTTTVGKVLATAGVVL